MAAYVIVEVGRGGISDCGSTIIVATASAKMRGGTARGISGATISREYSMTRGSIQSISGYMRSSYMSRAV